MATLTLFNPHACPVKIITVFEELQQVLASYGVMIDQWDASVPFTADASQETILEAYAPHLQPFMAKYGYQTADVINVHPDTKGIAELRAKFIKEHTHSEDEVRFFVEGRGYFWFRFPLTPNGQDDTSSETTVACVVCEAGDFIAVPAGYPHWFEMDAVPHVKVIRIFSDTQGWTPHYTLTGIETTYQRANHPYLQPTTPAPYRVVLLDIEGTITDIAFVHEVLFPYAQKHLQTFITQAQAQGLFQEELTEAFRLTHETLSEEQGLQFPTQAQTLEALTHWITIDRKHTGLKLLQGCLWQAGYEQGHYQGHLYPEVLSVLKAWQALGMTLAIYSSGSVQAQKLLFQYSEEGDVSSCFSHYFDTRVGAKTTLQAYQQIASQLSVTPHEILFLSDRVPELEAAHAAGCHVIQVCRDNRTTPYTTLSETSLPPHVACVATLSVPLPWQVHALHEERGVCD
jgi:enolase-phosphatase E1